MWKIFLYPQGYLKRLKELNVKDLWLEFKKDPHFLRYFPDISLKRTPDRKYFWKIFSVVKKDQCTYRL